MEQHSSLCWRPLKRQLSHLECLSLSGMLFSVSHYPPSSSAWVTAIPSSGHSLREASLSSIRFCCYNLSSYSLLFLNYTNSTCNHFSSKTVIAKCNYTFMSIWQVNQSVLGVETIYSWSLREPQGPAQCQAFKECVWRLLWRSGAHSSHICDKASNSSVKIQILSTPETARQGPFI